MNNKIKSIYPEVALTPVNKNAAMVFSGGENYNWQNKFQCVEWDICPQIKSIPKGVENLKYSRCDRVTIIGYYGNSGKQRAGTRWVGRCDCGRFVLRRAAAWKKAIINKTINRCSYCEKIEKLRKKAASYHKLK